MMVFIAALLAVAGLSIYTQIDRVATRTSAEQTAAKTQRSGPISTFPAYWTSFCDPKVKGNTTTKSNLSNVTYPDLWNTTTVVHLAQVSQTIVDSPAFVNVSTGHGWVVASWYFGERSGPVRPGYDIFGFFVLTKDGSPDGYVTTYYEILNGGRVTV
jgi:hypothetical protein